MRGVGVFRAVLAVGSALSLGLSGTALAEPLTVDEIMQLNELQIGDEAIIAKIESDSAVFNLSTDEMIDLRRRGLSSQVIASMLKKKQGAAPVLSLNSPDPMVAHPAGLYYLSGEGEVGKMERMNFTVSSQAKTGGIFGYVLTGGLASASVKVAIQNEEAPIRTGKNPKFYFFFDDVSQASSATTWASGSNTFVNSPAEFTLIELTKKEGRREARVGSMNIAGAKSGVMDKDRIAFQSNEIRPGVFEVVPEQELTPGEYGFIFSLGASGTAGVMTARVFDFQVR
ncbi:hypothetical protein H0274_13240 [Altererythrobacter sp. CC-YST694]|uniref:hypothetical protein n=1 Tax=Altererythrobacter sp. CC-YST694 TaxID=2755038 RepID=UPI001D007179|nr:hypothetical protein [Altererythrobacter sp. CC-YST694]MCB5426226.1 hypothetical protein [Altererythrobacter sp. CC-YST694]